MTCWTIPFRAFDVIRSGRWGQIGPAERLCCGDALFFTGILSNDCRGIADNIRCADLPHGEDLVPTSDEALEVLVNESR